MHEERLLLISPLVPDSITHNTKAVSDIRSLTGSLFGVAAGILGLESYEGFLFYLAGSLFVSALVVAIMARGDVQRYWRQGWWEVVSSDVVGGLSGFILTWTLFYGLVRV